VFLVGLGKGQETIPEKFPSRVPSNLQLTTLWSGVSVVRCRPGGDVGGGGELDGRDRLSRWAFGGHW
jgi:hypothetical protein